MARENLDALKEWEFVVFCLKSLHEIGLRGICPAEKRESYTILEGELSKQINKNDFTEKKIETVLSKKNGRSCLFYGHRSNRQRNRKVTEIYWFSGSNQDLGPSGYRPDALPTELLDVFSKKDNNGHFLDTIAIVQKSGQNCLKNMT